MDTMDKLIDRYIESIPKVELHLHLEASCSRDTYLKMLMPDKKKNLVQY